MTINRSVPLLFGKYDKVVCGGEVEGVRLVDHDVLAHEQRGSGDYGVLVDACIGDRVCHVLVHGHIGRSAFTSEGLLETTARSAKPLVARSRGA